MYKIPIFAIYSILIIALLLLSSSAILRFFPVGTIDVVASVIPFLTICVSAYFRKLKPLLLSTFIFFGQILLINNYSKIEAFYLMLPIFFLFISFFQDKGIWGKVTAAKYLLFFICFSLVLLIPQEAFRKMDIFEFTLFFPLNEVTFMLLIICFFFTFAHGFLENKPLDKSLPWALLLGGFPIIHPNSLTLLYLGLSTGIFLVAIAKDIYNMAFLDTLTQVPSRRAMDEFFERLSPPFSIAMADIDHFKNFNDKFGHDVGDEVLKQVAQSLTLTKHGKIFRYGGEEFAVVFKNKECKECKNFLDEVRENIVNKGFETKNEKVSLTLSFGVADSSFGSTIPEIVKCADEALYKAKKGGRNQVQIARHKKPNANQS